MMTPHSTYMTVTNSVPASLDTTPRFKCLLEAINELSHTAIDSLQEIQSQSVSGGDINKASLLTFAVKHEASQSDKGANNSQVFLKQNSVDNALLLFAESIGLTAMRQAGVRTCQPLAMGIDDKLGSSFLLLSAIYPAKSLAKSAKSSGWEDLALQLATLHQALPPQPDPLLSDPLSPNPSPSDSLNDSNNSPTQKTLSKAVKGLPSWYAGWFEDNFIGSNPQYNTWTSNWHEFFATYRLGPQTKMAYDNQLIGLKTVNQIERIQHKLETYLPNYSLTDSNGNPRPSLLHGDLWAGNAMIGNVSKDSTDTLGYLIDPAVYVGHPETDLAMTHLFGGFSSGFYDAYLEHCPIESGFTERMELYNLYHYLNHLNLFGTGYLSAVQRIAQRFGT